MRRCKCGHYSNFAVCDDCLLRRYKLLELLTSDSLDFEGLGPALIPEDAVIAALRKAERKPRRKREGR